MAGVQHSYLFECVFQSLNSRGSSFARAAHGLKVARLCKNRNHPKVTNGHGTFRMFPMCYLITEQDVSFGIVEATLARDRQRLSPHHVPCGQPATCATN